MDDKSKALTCVNLLRDNNVTQSRNELINKLILDVTKFFLLSSLSLSLIFLVVQAVNFLDYISEDGHGIYTYFGITILNFPKIFSRIMPFCVFITIFYIINKYELKNELLIFWNIGVKKIKFINTLVVFSLFFCVIYCEKIEDVMRSFFKRKKYF